MFNEILLTSLILLAAVFYVRYKGNQAGQQARQREMPQPGSGRMPMIIAIALVIGTLAISGALYYAHWRDSHTLYTVTVINTHSGAVQTYHVYRDDIDGRSFRTTDGRLISLSSAERMEVQEGGGDTPQ